jgi:quercetin dioxygenase-like cupin family protein
MKSAPEPVVVEESDCTVEAWGDPAEAALTWRTLLSGDRTSSEALTVGVAEIAPVGASEPPVHRHAQPEVYYVLSGRGVVRVAGRNHPLQPGTTVFIPGNVEHGAIATGSETLRILYVFAADSFADVEYVFP